MLVEIENLSIQESRLDEQIRLLSYAFPSAALLHCFVYFLTVDVLKLLICCSEMLQND
jgi:hypothetical protein